MSTNIESNGEDQGRAARLTAYALGQLGPAERAEVEAELAASPKAQEAVRAERALADQLRKAAQQIPLPERSIELRRAVDRRLQELESAAAPSPIAKPNLHQTRRRGRRFWSILAVAATLLMAAVPTYFYMVSRGAFQQGRDIASVEPSKDTTRLYAEPPQVNHPSAEAKYAWYDAESHGFRNIINGSPSSSQTKFRAGLDYLSDVGNGSQPKATDRSGLDLGVENRLKSASIATELAGGGTADVLHTPIEKDYNPTSGQRVEPGGITGTFTFGGLMTNSRVIGGAHKTTISGNSGGSLDLAGNNSYTGGTTINNVSGGLQVITGNNTYSGTSADLVIPQKNSISTTTTDTTRVNLFEKSGEQNQSHGDSIMGLGKIANSQRAEDSSQVSGINQLRRLVPGELSTSDLSINFNSSNLPKQSPQAQPFETWKPSRLVPNTSRLMVGDNEELPLRGMQVDVRIDGFRARVVVDLYYLNDHARQLEGNFQLRLPEEATPYFFAFGRTVYQAPQVQSADSMFFKRDLVLGADTTPEKILALRRGSWEEPKVARMVPKEKAAYAYRETVRRRVDPALVEWSGAGVFQCRVFPLAPQSLHRVVIGYDVDLLQVGNDLELRLDLPEQTPACVVDFNIAAQSEKQLSIDAPTSKSADGRRLSYRLIDPRQRPLVVRLHEQATTMLVGNDGKTENYFAVRLGVPLPTQDVDRRLPEPEEKKKAIFMVDTSLSAGPQFPLWTRLLRAVLENNRDQIDQFAVLFFNVETFWWQKKYVKNTPQNVEALLKYADGLALEGATDLGRALGEAAAPAWLKKADGHAAELFLMSDGAATWGEDRTAIMAATLKTAKSGPLFAYQTGLGGSDPRLLALLAQETGGAVFAVVGEAEIARASTAQRQRPWRLANVEMSGGHDLLVAGRPQCVFPGQQLLLVGRCEPGLADGEVTFTLKQDETIHTVRTKIDRVLRSELAARTYGQVAVGQLEDAAAAAAAVEPIATGYARHFRVTGRTCSLLMLESEQDYARFGIKPEEDDFLVSDRPAAAVVAKAAADSAAAQSDPKTSFLAWFRGLTQNSGVRFDLPASLSVALEGLPQESFAVAAPPLRCKVHSRQELPENVRQLWEAGAADYETLTAESQRRLARYGADDALRALSSLVEQSPGDAAVARGVAFSAIEWELPGQAYHLLRRASAGRTFEPITFHALAHCLEEMGHADLAIVYYELACGGQWDARFGDMHNIAQLDYFRFLRRLAEGHSGGMMGNYARARLATLLSAQVRDTADLVALVFWNTDGTDVDLHVTEPGGEDCYYAHRQTASGGQLSQDVTTGYGPEIYILPRAPLGTYQVRANYFATDANRASTRTKVLALIYQGWGTKTEKLTRKALTLSGSSEMQDLAKIAIGR